MVRAFKRGGAAASLLTALALVAGPAFAQGVVAPPAPEKTAKKKAYEKIEIPPLRNFTPPVPERVELPNGMVLFLLEDHELPTIDLVVTFQGGSMWETRDKAGLASITGEVMRTGGTTTVGGDDLDEQLESIAASIETGMGLAQATASLSCLTDTFDELLPILVDVVLNPAFPQEKVDLARNQRVSAIARRNDDPGGIASRELSRALYGDALPFGWTEEVDTIRGIDREDLVQFHKRFFFADRAVSGIVGDFDTAAMRKKLEAAFAALPKAPGPLEKAPTVTGEAAAKVYVVDRPEVNQTNIQMAHLGIRRTPDNADYFPVIVANTILGGGGFSSRLLQIVRTEMGLAYSVYSGYQAPYTHRGRFQVGCQTKNESTFQAIAAMRAEVDRIVTEQVSEEELDVAKESILQQLVFSNESRRAILDRAVRYERNDFPQDYLTRFQKGVAAVTGEDVLRVAKEHFKPEQFVFVLVGNVSAFGGDPATLGEVVNLDVDKPAWTAPKDEAAETAAALADPEAAALGREVLLKAIEARGGEEALRGVKVISYAGKGTVGTPQGPIPIQVSSLVAFPDKTRVSLLLPFGEVVQCYDGKAGWVSQMGNIVDLPASQGAELKKQATDDEIVTLLAALDLGEGPHLVGDAEVAGRKARVLNLGERGRMLFDAETHQLLARDTDTPQGLVRTTFSDYREVSGLHVPFSFSKSIAGNEALSITLEKCAINPEVAEDAFAKPAGK